MFAEIKSFFTKSWANREIRRKIIITALVLVVFRLTVYIPASGIDRNSLQALFTSSPLLSLLDVFSGGTLANFSIMALGLGPYITATIILQLLTVVVPKLKELQKEGEIGQERINQYTRFLTIPLALFQAGGMYALLISQGIISNLAPLSLIAMIVTMTTGTMFAVWLGELITEYGLGNGVSFLIFAGIVARMPVAATRTVTTFRPEDAFAILAFMVMTIVIIGLIVYVNEATRKIPLSYAKHSRRAAGLPQAYLPLGVNQAGVIPIIFAVSLVLMPTFISQFLAASGNSSLASLGVQLAELFNPQGFFYNLTYFLLVFGFTYFYTSIIFNPEDIAENLQKSGGFIKGVRPGSQTVKYLNYVLNRITMAGAVFLGLIAVIPSIASGAIGMPDLAIGGTGILIVVAVILEITRSTEAQLVTKQYDNLLR